MAIPNVRATPSGCLLYDCFGQALCTAPTRDTLIVSVWRPARSNSTDKIKFNWHDQGDRKAARDSCGFKSFFEYDLLRRAGDAGVKRAHNPPDCSFQLCINPFRAHVAFGGHSQRPPDGEHVMNRGDDEIGAFDQPVFHLISVD